MQHTEDRMLLIHSTYMCRLILSLSDTEVAELMEVAGAQYPQSSL